MAPPPEKPVFTLLPAVDVADGRAVRLVQGAAGTETDYGDPIEAARGWVEQGAPWIVGTAAMENPDWVRSAIGRHGDRIAVSLDVRGHTLSARGWTTEGGDLFETLTRLDADGCARYVVTDVEKDGMMHGPNLHLLKKVCDHTDRPVIASGGISRLEDLHKLADLASHGIEGVIIGRALYEGAFTLAEAVAAIEPRFDLFFWGPPRP
jgi:phosphoribosylformimino-5-aminoimidazole carboxamide ribonucleotide (ProFAR) isomerase